MGVLRNKESALMRVEAEEFNRLNPRITYDDYTFDESGDDFLQDNDLYIVFATRTRRKKKWKPVQKDIQEHIDGMTLKSNMGSRKWCRAENAKLVASFANAQDIVYDGSDIISETFSSFSRLLRDENKLKIWNEFVEKSEDEQKKILDNLDFEIKKLDKQLEQSSNSNFGEDITAELRFATIQKDIRKRLTRKLQTIRYDIVDQIENELVAFFSKQPSGTFSISFDCKLRRLYFLAVTRYLLLTIVHFTKRSESFEYKLVYGNANFIVPNCRLSQFLQDQYSSSKTGTSSPDPSDKDPVINQKISTSTSLKNTT